MHSIHIRLVLLIFLVSVFPSSTLGLWWRSSSPPSDSTDSEEGRTRGAEFALQGLVGSKGMKVVEDAKKKMAVPNTCWHSAYATLFRGCSEIMADEEKKKRLAWMLGDCFQKGSGRAAFPNCKESVKMVNCLKKLDDGEHKVFLEFFMETNSICHQLQSETFKHETERLVNDLAKSAHYAEEKLDFINEKQNQLLQDSNQIHDSLTSLQEDTQHVAQEFRDVNTQMQNVLESSQAIFRQSKSIAESQFELKEAQTEMTDTVKTSMNRLQESYENLGIGMDNLITEAAEIQREVKVVGDSMVAKMHELQGTANNIETVAGSSLEKQRQLLDGQTVALDGLDALRKFQYQALQESRDTLERFSEYGHRQHEELLRKQQEIQKTHDHLYQTSQAILEAQREFELKQSDIFSMLEKLYALYKAILDESRFIKTFFFYACVIILLYMLTSAKQTFRIRAYLYLGLCTTLLLEMAIIKIGLNDVIKKIWIARSTFLVGASIQILFSVFTYRDYEMMSHQLLQTLVEKVCRLEHQTAGKMCLSLGLDTEDDDSWSDYSWIDVELPEDVDINEDPNYLPEEVAENFTTTLVTRSYNLRPRSQSRHKVT